MPRRMAFSVELQARRRVATNAREARRKLALTQERAAELVGTSVQALQRMERAAAAVTIDYIARIADGYEIDLLELFVPPIGAWREPLVGRPRVAPREGAATPVRRAAEPRSTRRRRR